VDLDQINDIRK